MTVGRPKIKLSELKKGWKKILLDLGRVGGSEVEMRVELDISIDLWNRLKEEEEEFSQTISKAKELCKSWWIKQGRKNLKSRVFQGNLYSIHMRNRFGWDSKQEVKISGDLEIRNKFENLTEKELEGVYLQKVTELLDSGMTKSEIAAILEAKLKK